MITERAPVTDSTGIKLDSTGIKACKIIASMKNSGM